MDIRVDDTRNQFWVTAKESGIRLNPLESKDGILKSHIHCWKTGGVKEAKNPD
jgi:hypothetical protein